MASKVLISFGLLALFGCGPKNHSPKKSQTRTELAKTYLASGELTAARREAQKALKFDPGNAEAHTVLGLVDFFEAVRNIRLVEINDCLTGVDAEGLRSEMDAFLGAADKSFGKAVELDPEYSEAYANQAQVAINLEDYKRAAELGEKALEIPHRLINVSVTRANLGWARFHLGDDVGAAKELRQALQFNPQMCLANYRLGRVYFKREEWNKALEQFQVVVNSPECTIQEAHLYSIRSKKELAMTDDVQSAIEGCTALAPNSCVAAQCQAGL